ncbi:MAG TPA: ABC transporter transmembrane domain-containing protein, partial [Gemmatimonadales bacterium]
MNTGRRLLGLIQPYRWLLGLGLLTSFLASVLDGLTLVILIPLLKHLFGTSGELHAGSTRLEAFVDRVVEPLVAGLSPSEAAGRLVFLLALGLLLKNVMSYSAAQISVRTQEGLVRDLRTRLFSHLLTVEIDFFQRTRAGQLISAMITEVDQTKTVVTASLLSLFQNIIVVLTTLVILSQISIRLTLLTLAFVPVLVLGLQALLRRLRQHAQARARERGEITSTITERIGAI